MPLQGSPDYWAGEVEAQGHRYRVRELDETEFLEWERLGRTLQGYALDVAALQEPVAGESRADLETRLNKVRELNITIIRQSREQLNYIVSRALVWWDEAEELTPENAQRLPTGVKTLIAARASRETLLTQTEDDFLGLQPRASSPEIPFPSTAPPTPP